MSVEDVRRELEEHFFVYFTYREADFAVPVSPEVIAVLCDDRKGDDREDKLQKREEIT